MKRIGLFVVILLLSLLFIGCGAKADEPAQPTVMDEEEQIQQLVEDFGSRLQAVSLLAPKNIVSKSLEENYSAYVSPALLAKWQNDPENAPGRVTSSPWPDRIDISTIEKQSENIYQVQGEVIEVTSVEKEKGGFAAKRPITLTIRKIDNRWLIDDLVMGAYQEISLIERENAQYVFTLPARYEVIERK